MNEEEFFEEFKEILSKKPLTLSDKCEKCKEEHPELKNNRVCNYAYCIKEDWIREQYNYDDKEWFIWLFF